MASTEPSRTFVAPTRPKKVSIAPTGPGRGFVASMRPGRGCVASMRAGRELVAPMRPGRAFVGSTRSGKGLVASMRPSRRSMASMGASGVFVRRIVLSAQLAEILHETRVVGVLIPVSPDGPGGVIPAVLVDRQVVSVGIALPGQHALRSHYFRVIRSVVRRSSMGRAPAVMIRTEGIPMIRMGGRNCTAALSWRVDPGVAGAPGP